MAPVTFGFSWQKGPLLLGSRYFRMVKKRLYIRSGLQYIVFSKIGGTHSTATVATQINKADCIQQ